MVKEKRGRDLTAPALFPPLALSPRSRIRRLPLRERLNRAVSRDRAAKVHNPVFEMRLIYDWSAHAPL